MRLALLVETAHRESELENRREWAYNCDRCEAKGEQHDRVRKQCFRHYDRAAIAEAVKSDKGFRIPRRAEEVVVDSDAFLVELARLKALAPRKDYFTICLQFGVCPSGLVDDSDYSSLRLEGAAREYGVGYLQAYGIDPVPALLFDEFDVIRSTRNELDARKLLEVKARGKSKS